MDKKTYMRNFSYHVEVRKSLSLGSSAGRQALPPRAPLFSSTRPAPERPCCSRSPAAVACGIRRLSGSERSNRCGVESEEPSHAPQRQQARLGTMVDPRPADPQVSGDIVRIPESMIVPRGCGGAGDDRPGRDGQAQLPARAALDHQLARGGAAIGRPGLSGGQDVPGRDGPGGAPGDLCVCTATRRTCTSTWRSGTRSDVDRGVPAECQSSSPTR